MGAVKRQDEGRVEKPWGYEDRWAITDRYLGKILHIDAGQALSLQYHNAKDECILIVRGLMDLELDDDSGELVNYRLTEGDTVHITPGRKHRMTAVTDTDVFEVSTPEIDDVVRLEDRYGRSGT
jgi:mannose-6-phosphate isomerase